MSDFWVGLSLIPISVAGRGGWESSRRGDSCGEPLVFAGERASGVITGHPKTDPQALNGSFSWTCGPQGPTDRTGRAGFYWSRKRKSGPPRSLTAAARKEPDPCDPAAPGPSAGTTRRRRAHRRPVQHSRATRARAGPVSAPSSRAGGERAGCLVRPRHSIDNVGRLHPPL